jgi:hypothetical protein
MAEGHTAAAADAGVPADIVGKLKLRMIDHGLPLWSTEGWDDKCGGFVDRLDSDGRADASAPRRVFVQARQIYCYAKAAQMGWYADGREIALKGLEHLLAKAKALTSKCVRPVFVSGDHVVIRWVFEFVWLDGTHTRMEELACQRWDGERIAEETFFYDPTQLVPKAGGGSFG